MQANGLWGVSPDEADPGERTDHQPCGVPCRNISCGSYRNSRPGPDSRPLDLPLQYHRRTGVRVARHRQRLSTLPKDAGACWIISPTTPLTDRELSELMKWVRAGHVLMIASAMGNDNECELGGFG